MTKNLNNADPFMDEFIQFNDNGILNRVASVSVYFRNQKQSLIAEIEKADAVFGCIAWLTDTDLIKALVQKEVVSIVVNDFNIKNLKKIKDLKDLKDLKDKKNWLKLRDLSNPSNHFYSLINNSHRTDNKKADDCLESLLHLVPTDVPTADAQQSAVTSYEKMHHKFLIFAKISFDLEELNASSDYYYASANASRKFSAEEFLRLMGRAKIIPYAVWTGSFNLTPTANSSFENSCLIHDEKVSEQYFKEYAQIYYLSKKL